LYIEGSITYLNYGSLGQVNVGNDLYIVDNCSALSFTDRTPYYDGDGLTDLRKIKGKKDKANEIDHETLPSFAKHPEGRDLGAMVSILTKAVRQLEDEIIELKNCPFAEIKTTFSNYDAKVGCRVLISYFLCLQVGDFLRE
jgi:hypothetical protein